MMGSFLCFIVGAAALAAFTARRLRESSPGLARCGQTAASLLVGVSALWIALLASPLVDLASPCFPS
jgi:hypothetical protein